MIYLDANVFLKAILKERGGRSARDLLSRVQNGKIVAFTSALTFDEVFWIVEKHRGFDSALKATKGFLEMQNLTFIEVNDKIIRQAYDLAEKYRINPRDSIHAACAISKNINTIFSEDSDFDRIKEIKRKSLT